MISLIWLSILDKKRCTSAAAFYSKILVRIKNTRRKCKSSAWMEGDMQKVLETIQCRYTQQNFYCCFFVDPQNEEEPSSNIHFTFLQTKAFVGISKGWADKSVNLAIGDIQVDWVNPALCSSCVLHFRRAWFLIAFHFKEWLVIFSLLFLQKQEYSS